tara:strand:+ start:79 stop:552 length:474 start_codon:yes stop_codon:yes gene_type:complete
MERITIKQIERKINYLNEITGNPLKPYSWNKKEEKLTSNAGCYYWSGSYGGYKLEQICKGGGSSDPIYTGFVPKRELYNKICAFVRGIEEGLEQGEKMINLTEYGENELLLLVDNTEELCKLKEDREELLKELKIRYYFTYKQFRALWDRLDEEGKE